LGIFGAEPKKPSYRRNCSIDNMRKSPIISASYALSGKLRRADL
jgi:hypothetical protein